jgi:hypothetical protein
MPDALEQTALDAMADLEGGQAARVGLGEGGAPELAGGKFLQKTISGTLEEGVPGPTEFGKPAALCHT